MPPAEGSSRSRRRLLAAASGGVAAVVAGGVAAAYRFALEYRRRAGLPHPHPVRIVPGDLGLPFECVEITSGERRLPGWFVPAEPERGQPGGGERDRSDGRGPGIVVVHGWESNRGRSLTYVEFLRAAGFACLVFDVRGHGENPPEALPLTAAEFATDTATAARWLAGRPEIRGVGVLGHSMGAAGALIAAASEPAIDAVACVSAPADPVRLTRATFTLAELKVPGPLALPLAWLTARVFLAPRGHSLDDASATAAARRYRGPLFLAHGEEDGVLPVAHLERIADAARRARRATGPAATAPRPATGAPAEGPVETLVLPGIGHRWLYEAPEFRRAVAGFFAAALGGPVSPVVTADRAAACSVSRPAETPHGFGALGGGPIGDVSVGADLEPGG